MSRNCSSCNDVGRGRNTMLHCLVCGAFELVDDADVRCPGDNQRYVEVDEAGRENVVVGGIKRATDQNSKTTNFRVDQQRNVERQVVDPYVDHNRRSHARLESGAAELFHSEKSAEQSWSVCGQLRRFWRKHNSVLFIKTLSVTVLVCVHFDNNMQDLWRIHKIGRTGQWTVVNNFGCVLCSFKVQLCHGNNDDK